MKTWRVLPLLFFVILVIFLWRGLSLDPKMLPFAQLDKPLPPFVLPGLQPNTEFTSKQVQGQISLLNVWASWCESCRAEQSFLLALAQTLPIYGLNYKDEPTDARRWLQEFGNPYRAIGQDQEGKLAMDLGVYGVPETFLIDAQGRIRFRYAGLMDEKIWQTEFLPRIKKLKGKE